MGFDMAIRKSAVDADGSKRLVIDVTGGFFGDRERVIVGRGDVDVIGADTARRAIARKTGVTDEWNMGAGAIRGFYRPAVNGRVSVGNRRRDTGIGKHTG